MPRGKYTNHKGRSRRFTSAEELEEQRRQDEWTKQRRLERGDISSEESPEEKEKGSGESSSEESDSDEGPSKVKGVENLIKVENPNRIQRKMKKAPKTAEPEAAPQPELSRREREEIEKARATAAYLKKHAEGKTAQARADLARLAIVKQQREEAAKRRDMEKQEKEAAKQTKTAETQKALGKK